MKRCRLIYRSTAKQSTLNNTVLDELAKTSSKNNKRDGIVGVLILSGDQFLQVLEGPVRYVNQLYKRILGDPRHEEVELISYELINSPYFFDWSMRMINLNDIAPDRKQYLQKKYPFQNGALVLPDNLMLLYSLLHDARDMFEAA